MRVWSLGLHDSAIFWGLLGVLLFLFSPIVYRQCILRKLSKLVAENTTSSSYTSQTITLSETILSNKKEGTYIEVEWAHVEDFEDTPEFGIIPINNRESWAIPKKQISPEDYQTFRETFARYYAQANQDVNG